MVKCQNRLGLEDGVTAVGKGPEARIQDYVKVWGKDRWPGAVQ